MTATVPRVVRPRGELTDVQQEQLRDEREHAERMRFTADVAWEEYRASVVSVLLEGASFREVSAFTGLSKDTLQRWKREAK